MSRCAVSLVPERLPRAAAGVVASIERGVQLALCTARAPHPAFERRQAARYAFPYPIRLVPLAADGTLLPQEAVFVLGKHLSVRGLDFYGAEPLPFRRAIVCFERDRRPVVQLLLELTWCRFCRPGWYENGGRFLQAFAPGQVEPAVG
jgi:hypothetical protein